MIIQNNHKNNIKSRYLISGIFLILFILISFFHNVGVTHAATAEELQKKIADQQALIQQLDAKIKEYSDLADKTSAVAKSLNDVIAGLKQNEKILQLDIDKTKAEINKTSLDIQSLDGKIGESEDQISRFQDTIEKNIKAVYQNENVSIVQNFLSQRSLSSVLNELDQLSQFDKDLTSAINDLDVAKKDLENAQNVKVAKKQELVKFQTQLGDKKKVIEYNKAEQTKTLNETKNKQKTYQQILADQLAQKAAFEKELFSYESALKYTLDPKSIPQAGTAVFSWPLDKVIITQRFGVTGASKRLYVSGSHNGVDFGAKIGTPVKAVLSGTVLGSGDTDITCPRASFGRWVFIKHDNGLSTIYGHLSVISAKAGQRVATGDIIGYSGNTGYSTGPHLHISAYASDAVSIQNRPSAACGGKIYTMPIAPIEGYLDPMLYFPAPPTN